ncbi:ABC transporter substrate-binding protein [Paenibacillus sp. GCM10012307]|uniref:Extracellular solute-binding protein n=1 Tax=Paenibacillus roseus TaxID=2798579 RepID=A0A934J9N3_9BACL|nr:extracellular solute-binding protein [Paenibacillus roseus]MBJ6362885.1 extracellular solute-binding protein [Paenibacillus roseus]
MYSIYRKGIVYFLLLAVLIAGCSSKNEEASQKPAIDPDTPVTLKVAYMNEQMFYQTYGNIFSAKYSNVQFEVVPTMEVAMSDDPAQAMIDLIDAEQPDIVMLSMDQYETLATEGKLYELDAMIQQSGFDLDKIVGGVVQLLRDAGGGKLYGLSPTFNTKALYYNKDLFAQYNIQEPTDGMTWDEVMQLAARFPSDGDDETRIYGFSSSMFASDSFKLIQDMAAAKGLNYLNADATKLTMEEREWRDIFRAVVEGYQQKYVHMPTPPQQQGGEGGGIRMAPLSMLFMEGRAAMVVDNSTMVNMLGAGAGRGQVGSGKGSGTSVGATGSMQRKNINWGVVTAPVDASAPNMTSSYSVSQVFAINAASSQSAAAWSFIQYVHSDEAAKIRSNTSTELQSRIGYETNANGINLEAFYKLDPLPMETTRWFPKGFRTSFEAIANEEVAAAAKGSKSIDEAFDSILSRGADALAEANLSGEKEQGGATFGGATGVFIGG